MVRGAKLASAALFLFLLTGCDGQQSSNTGTGAQASQLPPAQNMTTRISAALDPCAQNGQNADFSRSVCSNQTLAALDGQVRTALAAQGASMTEAGARLLIDNQQHWREAQRVACGISAGAQASAEQQQCLENRFRARAQEAAQTVQSVGGYTFQRVQMVDAQPTPPRVLASAGAGADPALVSDINYPRIDGPQTPQVQRFNTLVAQQPQAPPNQNVNERTSYEIAYAGPALISVKFVTTIDGPQMARVDSTTRTVNILMATGRLLEAGDIFRSNSGWDDFLTRRGIAEIARQYRDYNYTPAQLDVHEIVTKPHLWLITERALVILFPAGSLPLPDGTDAQVEIPWNELRNYLSPTAPAPIRPAA